MISGTYVLTDTITSAYTTIVNDSFVNSDAVVSGKVAFKNDNSNTAETPAFPAAVLTKVTQLPDVDEAAGAIGDQARLIGHDGKVISTGAGEGLAGSIDPQHLRFSPLKLSSGRWPIGSGQIAIDKRTAEGKHFAIGDTIGVAADEGVRRFKISGIATYGDASSIGASTIAIFDVPTAQKLFEKVDKLDEIQVTAKDGVTAEKLAGEIRPLLPATAKVKTAAAQTKESVDDVKQSLGILQKFLLAFGILALFVGAFVICEHALDHDRAASAGVRNAAHHWQLAPAGAGQRHAGSARRRAPRLAGRPLPRAGDRESPERALRRNRASSSRRATPCSPRARSSSACWSGSSSP